MGLRAVFKLSSFRGTLWNLVLEHFRQALEKSGKRGRLIQIQPSELPGATVQVFRESIIVFCRNHSELNAIKRWFNETIGYPGLLETPSDIKSQGQRSLDYDSLEEVRNVISMAELPMDIQRDKFTKFILTIWGNYCEEEKFTAQDVAQLVGRDVEEIETFLDFASQLKFLHVKPPQYRLEKMYFVGSTPSEELLAEAESAESWLSMISFELSKRVAGFVRPWRILASELKWNEKERLLNDWYNEYYPEVHTFIALIPFAAIVGGFVVHDHLNQTEE